MNIEELELSLRTEFEGQVKNVIAGIQQDVADFQKNFEAEFEKHRTQLDTAIADLSTRMPQSAGIDVAFGESVKEHLRLARDDGAQIAATAFGEAEKLKDESTPAPSYNLIRDAINDISSKTSQAAILKTLVDHAEKFTARGAFFIVKNDRFVGWKVFGEGVAADENVVRDLNFALSLDTVLAASVNSMAAAEAVYGQHADEEIYLETLGLGRPDRMYAIPLTARGRGVAVLYADRGNGSVDFNVDALETLVKVAGLTVELLAASQTAKAQPVEALHSFATTPQEYTAPVYAEPVQPVVGETYSVPAAYESVTEPVAEEKVEEYQAEQVEEPQFETFQQFEQPVVAETEPVEEYTGVVSFDEAPVPALETVSAYEPSTVEYETANDFQIAAPEVEEPVAEEPAIAETVEAYVPDASPVVETFAPAPKEEVVAIANGNGNGHVAEPVVEVVTAPAGRTRLSDRNVDLPIEVADEERRLHNDARRFARLLVSEIKLYNEQKVVEGRESSDLYDRLREAIDRSREMYDKRVQPAVASKFDYFHYELVNSLAEGEDVKLGGTYPGAVV